MAKKSKRFLALILVLVMAMSLVTAAAFAVGTENSENVPSNDDLMDVSFFIYQGSSKSPWSECVGVSTIKELSNFVATLGSSNEMQAANKSITDAATSLPSKAAVFDSLSPNSDVVVYLANDLTKTETISSIIIKNNPTNYDVIWTSYKTQGNCRDNNDKTHVHVDGVIVDNNLDVVSASIYIDKHIANNESRWTKAETNLEISNDKYDYYHNNNGSWSKVYLDYQTITEDNSKLVSDYVPELKTLDVASIFNCLGDNEDVQVYNSDGTIYKTVKGEVIKNHAIRYGIYWNKVSAWNDGVHIDGSIYFKGLKGIEVVTEVYGYGDKKSPIATLKDFVVAGDNESIAEVLAKNITDLNNPSNTNVNYYNREADINNGTDVNMTLNYPYYVGLEYNGKDYGIQSSSTENINIVKSLDDAVITFKFYEIVNIRVLAEHSKELAVKPVRQLFIELGSNHQAELTVPQNVTPDVGYNFIGWKLNGTDITIDQDKTVAVSNYTDWAKDDNGEAIKIRPLEKDGITRLYYDFEAQFEVKKVNFTVEYVLADYVKGNFNGTVPEPATVEVQEGSSVSVDKYGKVTQNGAVLVPAISVPNYSVLYNGANSKNQFNTNGNISGVSGTIKDINDGDSIRVVIGGVLNYYVVIEKGTSYDRGSDGKVTGRETKLFTESLKTITFDPAKLISFADEKGITEKYNKAITLTVKPTDDLNAFFNSNGLGQSPLSSEDALKTINGCGKQKCNQVKSVLLVDDKTMDDYSVNWYVLKFESDGWHIDGTVIDKVKNEPVVPPDGSFLNGLDETQKIEETPVPEAENPNEDSTEPEGDETADIPDEDPALADAPAAKTGDTTVLWIVMLVVSGAAITTVTVYSKKHTEE